MNIFRTLCLEEGTSTLDILRLSLTTAMLMIYAEANMLTVQQVTKKEGGGGGGEEEEENCGAWVQLLLSRRVCAVA